jgi:hypothetical protein
MDYPGKVITKTQVTPTQTSASGNWTLDDQAAAIKNNNWPVALVPNPISKSLRFNSADSAYLNRTFGTPTNNKKFTYNCWVKVNAAGNSIRMLTSGITGSPVDYAMFQFSPNSINYQETASSATALNVSTVAVFRDPSAWYMVTLVVDTTLATATDRIKIYVNSVLQTLTIATQVTQNYDPVINKNTRLGGIGGLAYNGSYINFSDCYLTEVNFIDGQALTPSDFGLTNPQTGQWIPKKYTGTYGTNGFYLNFKDATSTTTLGYDYSGNANNWTTNNFSVTAGSGNDSLTDVPTPWVAYNTTGDVGGVVRGNYCTWNPLALGSDATLSNGNLDISYGTSGTISPTISTFGMSSGKWYWEITITAVSAPNSVLGITNVSSSSSAGVFVGNNANGWGYYAFDGTKYNNNSASAYGATYTTNDVIGFAFDADAGSITAYKNGVSQGVMFSSLAAGTYYPAISDGSSPQTFSASTNFGQRPFAYTPPAGFLSLCTTNLPATTIGFGLTNQGDDYFNAVAFTSVNGSSSVTVGFEPDFTWIKDRQAAIDHFLHDVNRGYGTYLVSNSTAAEGSGGGVTARTSTGFNYTIGNANNWISWNWKAGGTGVTNTVGSITSTVSANTTSGFSVVTWTGNGGSSGQVGTGLSTTSPIAMAIVKRRSGTSDWWVGHRGILGANFAYRVLLNSSAANSGSGPYVLGSQSNTNGDRLYLATEGLANTVTYVAYCFQQIAGYSAFGSYTGNGSTDGPFVYLGFRPRYLLIKISSGGTGVWYIWDSSRDPYNFVCHELYANTSAAEYVNTPECDFVSNGFKMRSTFTDQNGSGNTYIYAAFAESPFQFSNAR